jgi:hypothetical protein
MRFNVYVYSFHNKHLGFGGVIDIQPLIMKNS